ncbi:sulfate ABC transporter permease subunit CysW [Sporolactobacillus terrae]|uniref:Sulfate ABC transporter permease subunit CysW n=1 Tax=Sporolactobacillus terrae TaxID=269673 RepID=A0ABX5Q9Q8_9BACL|nr:sulfate ABC transporter permease subunit CysW [Sporolactobacillus terrae]QAA23363.1 sulfate ABC transporter permease subunit CysW [Sporolactobacillus terrae]QAA26335.1 sulfate ABC transporter permease subunit CysW [Sporolactobacillus terrae]UAK15425.1 sulfate ABC transporter permease subunit CysW [Sporolactobacillus terrae]
MESTVQPNLPGQAFTARHSLKGDIVRWSLITIVLLFFFSFLIIPLVSIFFEAFRQGVRVYLSSIVEADALSAIRLTLFVTLIVVPINAVFGILFAWVITKYSFRGKNFLITLIDLPFSVSPVIGGLIFILLFGQHSSLGQWLISHNINIVFNVPGIVLATLFVTFPFISRELIPLMQSQGTVSEEASIMLGASAWQTFIHVTLPNIKWALFYGIILCNARSIGEFGAVSVVSGHIRGMTNTMPLQIENLYNEYQFVAAFAIASIMSLLAILTMVIKVILENFIKKQTL